MRKKVFSGVFALVVLLIAGYGVNKSMNSHADLNDLALRNVLALADVENPDPGENGPPNLENECRKLSMGFWNEALHCVGGGDATVKCTVKGQLNFAGKIINGQYEVGIEYPILWERWSCELSPGNCCDGSKQGVNWAA